MTYLSRYRTRRVREQERLNRMLILIETFLIGMAGMAFALSMFIHCNVLHTRLHFCYGALDGVSICTH
jgi:hypothetical protein